MTNNTKSPSKDLEYAALFNELQKRKQPTKLVDLPAGDDGKPIGQVLIRTLTHDDHVDIQRLATIECDRIYKEEKVDKDSKLYTDRYDNICAKHFLFRALRDPDNEKKPFFPTADHVGKFLSNDEITILMKNYATLQDEKGPIIAYMDDAKFEEWVSKLAEGAESAYFLDRFLPQVKDQFLLYMASQLLNYQTGKFSATSPVKSSTESE